jgi:hypothetical protein
MEKIIVKSLKRVGDNSMLVIGVNGNREATMNAKWQKAEMVWIEENVGVGGSFQGELTQKGQYLNVTAVDMTSAVKGVSDAEAAGEHEAPQEAKGSPNPQRVGLFIKLAVEMMIANPKEERDMTVEQNLCENIQEIKKLEEFTIKLLG